VQFAVSPKESNRLVVDSLSLKICAMSSSTFEANIYYSKDPTFVTSTRVRYADAASNNYLPTSALELLALTDLNITVEPGETFISGFIPGMKIPVYLPVNTCACRMFILRGKPRACALLHR